MRLNPFFQLSIWIIYFITVVLFSLKTEPLSDSLVKALIIIACQASLFYIIYLWLTPRYFEQKKLPLFFALTTLAIGLITPIRFHFSALPIAPGISTINKPFFILSTILVSEIIISLFAVLQRLADTKSEMQKKLTKVEAEQLKTELSFLRSQINPHFMFNTLNNIYALTIAKSDLAPVAVQKLSETLRYILYESSGENITIQKEITLLENYIEITKLKFKEKPNIQFTSTIHQMDMKVEPLVLLPLIENAFKYSGVGAHSKGYIFIDLRQSPQGVHVSIENSILDEAVYFNNEGGIGLTNTEKRMQLKYGAQHTFRKEVSADTFSIELTLPAL